MRWRAADGQARTLVVDGLWTEAGSASSVLHCIILCRLSPNSSTHPLNSVPYVRSPYMLLYTVQQCLSAQAITAARSTSAAASACHLAVECCSAPSSTPPARPSRPPAAASSRSPYPCWRSRRSSSTHHHRHCRRHAAARTTAPGQPAAAARPGQALPLPQPARRR